MAARREPKSKHPESRAIKGADYLYTIKILSHPVNMFKVKQCEDPKGVGEWHPTEHEIYTINDFPSYHAQADREMHEILHAVSTVALPEEARLSELQVNTLSLALVDLFARNPHFLARLVAFTAEDQRPADIQSLKVYKKGKDELSK